MRLTQGTFSYLPDLSDEQIATQIKYCLDQGWAVNVEYTDDPHPRNSYWEIWDLPMFDLKDPAGVMLEVNACRDAVPNQYVRVSAFDATRGVESLRLSFIVNRPAQEPGFHIERQQVNGRSIRYTVGSYATREPAGKRYTA